MENVKEFRSLEQRLERIEKALMDGGLLPSPPIPAKPVEAEVVACTITDRPVLVSPFGKPRYTQAGLDIEHCGVVQHPRVDFVGYGRYYIFCQGACKRKLAVDITLGALQ